LKLESPVAVHPPSKGFNRLEKGLIAIGALVLLPFLVIWLIYMAALAYYFVLVPLWDLVKYVLGL
jgi:hypothetical protein